DRRPPDGPGALSLRPRALGGSRAHRRRTGQLRGGRRRGRDRGPREAAELREGAGGVDGPASEDPRNPPGLQVRLARRGGPGGPGRGHVSLSLEGRKRLGVFPPPVKAINFSNVPLALLVRTFARKEAE